MSGDRAPAAPRPTAILLGVVLLAPPAAAWQTDLEGRVAGGAGEHLSTRCCPASRHFTWGGVAGRVESSPRARGESRLLLSAQADLRLGQLETDGGHDDTGATFHAATATVGFDSRYFAIEGGAFEMSDADASIRRVLPAAAVRIGDPRSFWVGVDLLDEPSCVLPTCLVGLSYGVVLTDSIVLRHGFSIGKDKGRTWALVPFATRIGWWLVGAQLEVSEPGLGGWLAFGVRSPWPV